MTSVRPAEFEVDTDDPFKHDRLARRGRVEALCRLIVELQSPAVLAVNGPFGSGKSVFLRLCAAQLRDQGVNVVEFNAWQQSHTEVPLVDLVAALTARSTQAEQITEKLRQVAVKLAWRTASAVTHGIVDGEASQTAGALSMFEEWKDIEDRREEFRQELTSLVGDAGKLVVFVDELDRCPPERALRILDVVRHLFDIPGVVVVLGINELELRYRVTKLYGDDCEAEAYLRRFIDLAIDLPGPGPSLVAFLNEAFAEVGIADQLEGEQSRQLAEPVIKLLAEQMEISARDILQLTHRIARVLALIPSPEPSSVARFTLQHTVLSMCVLRTAVPETYRKYVSESIDKFKAVADLMGVLSLDIVSASNSVAELIVIPLLAIGIDDWREVDSAEFHKHFSAVNIDDVEVVEQIRRSFNHVGVFYCRFQLGHVVDLIELAV